MKKSTAQTNQLAAVEGSEAIQTLKKLWRADKSVQRGLSEMLDLKDWASEYAQLDSVWREDVKAGFRQLYHDRDMTEDEIFGKIADLDKVIDMEVGNEKSIDRGELNTFARDAKELTDQEEQHMKSEMQDLDTLEQRRQDNSMRSLEKNRESIGKGLEDDMDDANAAANRQQSIADGLSGTDAKIAQVQGIVDEKQAAIQGGVDRDRAQLERKLQDMSGSLSLAELKSTETLNGRRVAHLIAEGVPLEDLRKVLLSRHRKLLDKVQAQKDGNFRA